MSTSEITSKKTKYILLTNGDSYAGRTLAIYIADQLMKREGQLKKHWRLRVLCEDRSVMKDLEKRGIEVREVDYESQSMLREQMKINIKALIFNPFTSTGRLIHRGKNLIDAAIHEKVKRILMMGCSSNQDSDSSMEKFSQVESYLRDRYKYGAWVVFRIPLIQQFMHFWSSMIENKSVIGLPMSESDYLLTVNIMDVCECVCQAALSNKCSVWANQHESIGSGSGSSSDYEEETTAADVVARTAIKRVYELTCAVPASPYLFSKALSEAVRKDGFDTDVEATVITDEQLENYLKFVSEGKKKETESFLSVVFQDKRLKRRKTSSESGLLKSFQSLFSDDKAKSSTYEQDDPNWYPAPKYLNPFCIELILDHFRNTRSPDMPNMPSSDVFDITGRAPIEISEFFMENRRQFRPE
ncbi:hypothetical protein INT48_006557 [Thamnidium elegans]|uniref:NmrA-like domain-containing protein n=1 Tax=Thamnidium elegans TaxID=101142 RepID=A0A8H7SMV6_9FUNG|nr:hypothetical protein INT48_006557 [Thamnidium elegans]